VTGVLFVNGCAITTLISLASRPFIASVPQLAATAVLVAAAIAAFLLFTPGRRLRPTPAPRPAAPAPWLVALASPVPAAAFGLVERTGGSQLAAVHNLLSLITCEAVALLLIARWSRRGGWGPKHHLALAPGPLLTYSRGA
jgi:hypothetical protein